MRFVETVESTVFLDMKTKKLILLAIGVVIRCESSLNRNME
ncbi:hypothetical protein [Thermosphaera sp.]